jgi:hypothetical protein
MSHLAADPIQPDILHTISREVRATTSLLVDIEQEKTDELTSSSVLIDLSDTA